MRPIGVFLTLPHLCPQALFAWVCSWPRATIQGALSKIPGNLALFAPAVNSEILYAGIFTLAVCAPLGAVALDLLGGALLRKIKAMEDQIQVCLQRTAIGLINEH